MRGDNFHVPPRLRGSEAPISPRSLQDARLARVGSAARGRKWRLGSALDANFRSPQLASSGIIFSATLMVCYEPAQKSLFLVARCIIPAGTARVEAGQWRKNMGFI